MISVCCEMSDGQVLSIVEELDRFPRQQILSKVGEYIRHNKQLCERSIQERILFINKFGHKQKMFASETREMLHVLQYHDKVEIREVNGDLLFTITHKSISNTVYTETQKIMSEADHMVNNMIREGLDEWTKYRLVELCTCVYGIPKGAYRLLGLHVDLQGYILASMTYVEIVGLSTDYSDIVSTVLANRSLVGPKMCLAVYGEKLVVATIHPKTSYTYRTCKGYYAYDYRNDLENYGCNCKYSRFVGCLSDFVGVCMGAHESLTHRVTTALDIIKSVHIKEMKLAKETRCKDAFVRWLLKEVANAVGISNGTIKTHKYVFFDSSIQRCSHGNYEAVKLLGSTITLFQKTFGDIKAYVMEL